MTLPDKKLPDELDLIAEHIGDDQPNLPEGAKNTILLAAKEIKGLREVVAKLPKTADGVPVVPGMTCYTPALPSKPHAERHTVVYIRNNSPRIGITTAGGVIGTNLQHVYGELSAAEEASKP